MRIALMLLACALSLGAGVPARSQVTLDVSKITCWQYVAYKVTNPKYLAVWLSGFRHGKNGETIVDMQAVVENAAKLERYCGQNPDIPMMQAAETVLGSQD